MITFKKSVYILRHFKTFRLTIPHPDIFNPPPKRVYKGLLRAENVALSLTESLTGCGCVRVHHAQQIGPILR